MEQNNFEKDIQQRLDDLKIPPSDSVWTNVEKRIPKKGKERRMIFILSFLLLFIAAGGYWLLNSENKNQQQDQKISKVERTETAPSIKKSDDSSSFPPKTLSGNIPVNNDSSQFVNKEQKSNETIFKNNTEEKLIKEKEKNVSHKGNKNVNKEMASSAQKNKPGIKENIEIRDEDKRNDQKDESSNKQNLRGIESEIASVKIKVGNSDSNSITQNKINADTLLKKVEVRNTVAKLDSVSKKLTQDRKEHKWVLGITFSAGTSMIGKDPLGINNQSSSLNSDYYNGIPSNPNFGYSIPSAIRNSLAVMGGAFVEKNISSRNKISMGISYRYFSLMSKVGTSIDSVVTTSSSSLTQSQRFYNAENNTNNYRNNFHYLEIPVSFQFKLNRSESLPLNWLVGITVSQLISSNALQFKSIPGLYYSDNSLFNKTQIGLQTGLSFTFFSKGRNPLIIGPYISYNTSKLAGKGLYGDKHFSFLGIHSEILFPKK